MTVLLDCCVNRLPGALQPVRDRLRWHGQRTRTHRARVCAGFAAALVTLACGGCSTLLPTSKKEVVSDWRSYDEAVRSLAAFEPYKATRNDLHRQGLDPRSNPAIIVLHFADVLQRFSAAALIKPGDVDRGIRDCLQVGKQCNAYAIAVKKINRDRVGNFWVDSLNFRRETVTTGWNVEALLVFVDDLLVYQLVGGQPTINEYEQVRNPLGPLQGWGGLVPQALQ
jgi:hypothetical protein